VTVTNNIPIEGAEAYKGYASASCGPAATAYQTGGGCSVVCECLSCVCVCARAPAGDARGAASCAPR
jgi:hypothetical protein